MTPQDRASVGNLILMCATHGREIDAPDTGEANFSVELLRSMKVAHEAKVTEAINEAIEQDQSGIQTASGALDTGLRKASAASTAEGLLESLGLDDDKDLIPKFVESLNAVREDLQRLSQLALDTLSQLLQLWLQECRDDSGGWRDFGDPSDTIGPFLPLKVVENRIKNGAVYESGLSELKERDLVSVEVDEDMRTAEYAIRNKWRLQADRYGYNFWISATYFLYQGYRLELHEWIKGLEFDIFDRPAPEAAHVQWR